MGWLAPAVGVAAPGDPAGISRIPAEEQAYLDGPLVFRRKLPAWVGATALAAADEIAARTAAWQAPTFAVLAKILEWVEARV